MTRAAGAAGAGWQSEGGGMDAQERNVALAKALGWTQLQWGEDDADDCGIRVVNNWHGVAPDGEKRWLPDFTGSVDACLAALPEDMWVAVNTLYKIPVYRAHLRVSRPGKGDIEWNGEGATRAEALANAVLSWALAQQEGKAP